MVFARLWLNLLKLFVLHSRTISLLHENKTHYHIKWQDIMPFSFRISLSQTHCIYFPSIGREQNRKKEGEKKLLNIKAKERKRNEGKKGNLKKLWANFSPVVKRYTHFTLKARFHFIWFSRVYRDTKVLSNTIGIWWCTYRLTFLICCSNWYELVYAYMQTTIE